MLSPLGVMLGVTTSCGPRITRQSARRQSNTPRLAVEYGPDDPNALWMAGHTLSYCNAGSEEGAHIIDRALSLNPNSATAWAMSGWAQSHFGQHISAIERSIHAYR